MTMSASASSSAYYYYDAHSRCIKYAPSLIGEDGAVTITAAIVDVDGAKNNSNNNNNIASSLPLGKLLMGEIIEIMDPSSGERNEFGQQSSQLFVQSASASASASLQAPNADADADADARWSTVTAEQILQRHRQVQSLHAKQHQRLLYKHMKDWQWCYTQNLSVQRLLEMQDIHQRESMELHSRQQREQSEMLDFIVFNWVPMNFKPFSESTHLQQHAATSTTASLIATRGGNSTTKISAELLPMEVEETSTAAPQSALMASSQHAGKEKLTPSLPDPPSLPDRISIDRQKADEIKSVMRNRSLSQTERQKKLAEIREKYIAGTAGDSTTTLPFQHSSITTNDKISEQSRQMELQAVIKDPSLSREAKLERVALINAKYAESMFGHPTQHSQEKAMTQNAIKGEMQSRSMSVPSSTADGHDKDVSGVEGVDGEEEDDQSLNSGAQSVETNRSSGSPQSSHFSTSSSSTSSSSSSASSSSREDVASESDNLQQDDANVGGGEGEKGEEGGIHVDHSGESSADANADATTTAAATATAAAHVPDHSQSANAVDGHEVPTSSSNKGAPSRWEMAIARLSTAHLVGNGVGANDSNRSDKPSDSRNAVDDGAANVGTLNTSTNIVTNTVSDDPFQGLPTERTPIKKLVEKLNNDDASLTVLKLDGRTQIKENDWKSLFQSLESNSTLTHLSISRCEINDELAVALVLAMVVNETIVGLRLNHNEGLTDETGKGFIKVLRQSNSTIKQLEVNRTKIAKKLTQELNKLLEERNPKKAENGHQKQIKSKKKDRSKKVSKDTANGKDEAKTLRRRSIISALAKSVTSSKRHDNKVDWT